MSYDLLWKNIVAYCLQVGLLVGLAAFAPVLLRLRMPRARLVYWQVLLAACLLLPLVQPWRQAVINSTVELTSVVTTLVPTGVSERRRIPTSEIVLGLLAAGALGRFVWLGVGFWKLCLYRRRSRPLRMAAPWQTRAEICVSNDVSSPVTFGLREPVVLVPAGFAQMNERARTAILCHELLHVDRHDWLFTIGEELVRSVFWFHPAIWWLLGEIQLAREQAVDREVIDITQAREDYLDALLAIAGANPRLDLAPAPLFLRRRHLKQRVVSLLKEGPMSRARLAAAGVAGLGLLLAACWLASTTFPLSAAPRLVSDARSRRTSPMQPSADAPQATVEPRRPTPQPRAASVLQKLERIIFKGLGDDARREVLSRLPVQEGSKVVMGPEFLDRVTRAVQDYDEHLSVTLGHWPGGGFVLNISAPVPTRIKVGGNVQQARLISQPKPVYPPEAKAVRLQGVVKLAAVIAKDGTMQQLEVISGHPLLVASALEAVKNWVYDKTTLNGIPVEVATQIDVNYTLSQ